MNYYAVCIKRPNNNYARRSDAEGNYNSLQEFIAAKKKVIDNCKRFKDNYRIVIIPDNDKDPCITVYDNEKAY